MSNIIKQRRIFSEPNSNSALSGVSTVNSGIDITIDNTDPANPIVNFTGTFQDPITVVANYSSLPTVGTVSGKFYWCSSSQGTKWLPGSIGGTYYDSGLYYSNGASWEYLDVPYNATQSTVNTGTNNDQFVTASTFNNASKWSTKQDTLTIGNLTDVGTDGIVITNGSNSIIGTGTSIAQHVADTTHNGYINSTDWNTFNNKQTAGSYITAITGDANATGPGSSNLILATVNSTIGTFGSVTKSTTLTTNSKGLITSITEQIITPSIANITGLGTGVSTALAISINTVGSLITNGGTLGTPSSGIATNLTGTASGLTAGNVTTNANLTGDITSIGNITTLTNAPVIAKVLTGYISGSGSISSSDSILSAIQKLNGNINTLITGVSSVNSLTGSVALTGTSNRITISAANIFDISTSYVGQSSITTLGTITTGVWTGTAIADANLATAYLKADGSRPLTGNWTIGAFNFISDTITGIKFGTTTNQKLGFFNSTPIVQPTGSIITALQNLGLISSATVQGAELTITDVITNNVSITAHGFAPKAPNDATKYLDGTGTYSVPISSAGNLTGAITSIGLATSLGSFTSAQLLGALTDETGGLKAVFSDAPTFTTNITTPFIIGGTGVGSFIKHQSTTGTGTTTGIAHEFWGGTNGGTNLFNIYNDAQFLVNTTTRILGSLATFRIGQGTSTIDFGEVSSGLGALYFNSATPSTTNYCLKGNGTQTILNGSTSSAISANNTNKLLVTVGAFALTPGATSSGVVAPFTFTGPTNTAQTAATEAIGVNWDLSAVVQHASNTAVTTQRAFLIKAPTYSFASATGTITTAATLAIDKAPVVGANAAITNAYSLWVQAGLTRLDGGLSGITDASSAGSGIVGETIVSTVSTYTNYTTTATYQNVASITLTPGDWQITAFGTLNSNTATITAASNCIFLVSTTTASATGATEGLNISYIPQSALVGTSKESTGSINYNVSISSNTTYYLNTQATFTLGNPQYVGTIQARRLR